MAGECMRDDMNILQPGTQLDGRYEVVRLLGQGGMAAVYEVRHLGLHSTHALKVLNENRERVSPEERSPLESAIQDARKALDGDDAQAIRRSIENLQRTSQAFAEALQKGAPHGRGAGPGGQGRGGLNVKEGEVIDAEPVESRDQK